MKGKNSGASALRYVLTAIAGIVLVALLSSGARWLHRNNSLLTSGETEDLAGYIDRGEELPVGRYVHLDVRTPLGAYASQTSSNSIYGLSFDSGKDYFYAVLLDDGTVLTVKFARQEDVDALDALRDGAAPGQDETTGANRGFARPAGAVLRVQGKLRALSTRKIIDILVESLGIPADDPRLRLVMIDTTAVRGDKAALFIGVPALAIAALIVLRVLLARRRKRAAAAQGPEAGES